MRDQITVGSMFAGIGGICLGFKQNGCKIIWANEIDKYACGTYRLNFGKLDFLRTAAITVKAFCANGFDGACDLFLLMIFPFNCFRLLSFAFVCFWRSMPLDYQN